jgi:acyl carrier protein
MTSETTDRPAPPTDWPELEDEQLLARIIDVVAEEGMVDREAIVPTATIESLGLDSIEVVMILNGVEEKFDVYIPMDGEITEVRNLAELVAIMAKQVADGAKHPSEMTDEASETAQGSES